METEVRLKEYDALQIEINELNQSYTMVQREYSMM